MDKYNSFMLAKKSGIVKPPTKVKKEVQKEEEVENVQPSLVIKRAKAKEFTEQKQFIELEFDRLKFLYDTDE